MINDTICLQEFASLKSSESASTLYDDVQSIGSKSKVWHFLVHFAIDVHTQND